ncbi:hypothetical protein VIBNIAM115_80014 [Vibrio nigripulchritudo AM115]|nr:hypothetical protein VIBNIAM115_80014 [Vibrio nigripulchritudo AM115]
MQDYPSSVFSRCKSNVNELMQKYVSVLIQTSYKLRIIREKNDH